MSSHEMYPTVTLLVLEINSRNLPLNENGSERFKRWSLTEIQRCGPVKGYSCMSDAECHERYLRKDTACFEVYPCISSCIFLAQLSDLETFIFQVNRFLTEGVPLNTRNDTIEYVRSEAIKTAEKFNLSLPLEGMPKQS